MISPSTAAERPLEALIMEQMAAAEQVMVLGRAIASHLAHAGAASPDGRAATPTTLSSTTPTNDGGRSQQGGACARWVAVREEPSPSEPCAGPLDLEQPLLVGLRSPGRPEQHEGWQALQMASYSTQHLRKTVKDLSSKIDNTDSSAKLSYHTRGAWQALARHPAFETTTILVVFASTFWIAFETDNNKADILCNAPVVFQVVDNLFCAYFVLELLVRFMACRCKADAFKDAWFVFDGLLALLMAWETWIQVIVYVLFASRAKTGGFLGSAMVLRVFRILRLFRFARTGRLVRAVPELLVFIQGLVKGIRGVIASLCALMFFIYIFAIIFTQLLSSTDTGAGTFENVPQAMNFLFLSAICSIDKAFVTKLWATGWAYWLLFLLFLLITNLAIMKMLTGVLVNIVSDVTKQSAERSITANLRQKLTSLIESGNAGADGLISQQEFDVLIENPAVLKSLVDLGLDVVAFADFTRPIIPKEGLPVDEVSSLMLQFRGTKNATVKDIVDMRKFVAKAFISLEARMSGLATAERRNADQV